MNFLSNLFGGLFGKKKKDEGAVVTRNTSVQPQSSAPIPQPTYSQPDAPTPTPNLLGFPSSESLSKTTPAPPMNVGSADQNRGYFDPGSDNMFWNGVDKLRGGNSLVGENGYFQKQVNDKLMGGLAKVIDAKKLNTHGGAWGTAKNVGSGLMDIGAGAVNATPIGLAASAAISQYSGALKAARGEYVNPLEEFNNRTPLSEGWNIENPYLAGAVDIGSEAMAFNPTGTVASVAGLKNLKNAGSASKVGSVIWQSFNDLAGFNPSTSGYLSPSDKLKMAEVVRAKAATVAPGVKSVNPKKLEQVDEMIDIAMQNAPDQHVHGVGGKALSEYVQPGVSRPMNQTDIEAALNRKDIQGAWDILDSMPVSDPSKGSMKSLMDSAYPRPPKQVPGGADVIPMEVGAITEPAQAPLQKAKIKPLEVAPEQIPEAPPAIREQPVQAPEQTQFSPDNQITRTQIPGEIPTTPTAQVQNALVNGNVVEARGIIDSLPNGSPEKDSLKWMVDNLHPEKPEFSPGNEITRTQIPEQSTFVPKNEITRTKIPGDTVDDVMVKPKQVAVNDNTEPVAIAPKGDAVELETATPTAKQDELVGKVETESPKATEKAQDVVESSTKDAVEEARQGTEKTIKEFDDARSNYKNDEEFYNDYVLNKVEQDDEAGEFARHISRNHETRGTSIDDLIKDAISENSPAGKSLESEHNFWTDELRQISRDNKQPQVLKKFNEMSKDMNIEDRTNLAKNLVTNYRDKGGKMFEATYGKGATGKLNNQVEAEVVPKKIERLKKIEPVEPKPLKRTAIKSEDLHAAKTGEVGKSKGKLSKGQEFDKTSIEASRGRGARESTNTSYSKLISSIDEQGAMTSKDADTVRAMRERFPKDSEEYKTLTNLSNAHNTDAAQTMSLIERTLRRTASPDQLTDRFIRRLYSKSTDSKVISSEELSRISSKNKEFVDARDEFNASIESFNKDASKENADKVLDNFLNADSKNIESKFEEFKLGKEFLKTSKHEGAAKFLDKLRKDSEVYSMDWVDSSFLSSFSTMFNNLVNTTTVRAEESVFGGIGAKIANKMTGADLGGGINAGQKIGSKIGMKNLIRSMVLRQGVDENIFTKTIKNFTTTGNTAGDANTYATAYASTYGHYLSSLKKAGYTGEELERRALVNSLVDPDNVVAQNMHEALANNALVSTITDAGSKSIESIVHGGISKRLGDSPAAKTVAKGITRVLMGYPGVIGRSAAQGSKRVLLGTPSYVQAAINAVKGGDPEVTAKFIKNGIKETGSGTVMISTGVGLAMKGLVSGSYPTDKDEKARWQREQIQENSIKIGDNWYEVSSPLGVFAIPLLTGANLVTNVKSGQPITQGIIKSAIKTSMNAMPVSSFKQAMDFFDDVDRGRDVSSQVAKFGASLTRSLSPLGSLTNQFAKMFDENANDLTQSTGWGEFIDRVRDGVPGLNIGLPDKEIDGSVIKNPGPIAKLFGARGTDQPAGIAKTQRINEQIDGTIKSLNSYGAFNDDIKNLLDDETKSVFEKAKSGKKVDESDMKDLISQMTKGVTESDDTRFLEDEKYDSNLAVLKAKRDMLSADPTTRRDTIEGYDTQIKRGEVYKTRRTPYKDIREYSKVDLTTWRDMGDPESESYDQERYQKLWELDQSLAEAGASRNSKDPATNKYYVAKKKGSGSGGGGGSKSNTIGSFQQLKKVSVGNFSGQRTGVQQLKPLRKLKAGELPKRAKISVSK